MPASSILDEDDMTRARMIETTCHRSHVTSGEPEIAACFEVEPFIEARMAEHGHMIGTPLTRLRRLACDAAEANTGVAELAEMDRKIACFCNDLPECCRREEQMVFPALVRLQSQTHITSCRAGMIAARLRFMIAEQQALLSELAGAIEIIERHRSPAGSCESCHELLREAQSFEGVLVAHIRREQEELFAWGVAREAELVQKR
jgi:iron-sulfur cluster repair protein YtfE (RIC family)